MEFRVLGALEIVTEGHVLPLGGPKPRLLLAVLLARRGQVVSTDRLVDVLWADDAPATAVPTLQTHLSRLRRLLETGPDGPGLENRPPGYRLAVPASAVDADRFEAGVDDARGLLSRDPPAARRAVDAALAEWSGSAFAEFADLDVVRAEAGRLEELRLVAHELAVDARLACGGHREVVGELEGLVDEHPLRERLWSQLMLALYRSGRPAEALRRAQQLRRLLREELGLGPTAEVRALENDILTEDPGLDRPPPPVRASAGARVDLDALVGRTEDIDVVRAQLARSRLVTLTGPGGVGKTRLAHELVPELAPQAPDGVRWIELAAVRWPEAAIAALANELDLQRRPERSLEDSIVEALRHRGLVLLLDNCEHVLEAVAPLVSRILRWCPDVRILATSREPLGLPGEATYALAPLAVPASAAAPIGEVRSSPAVALFAARATAARHDFALDARSSAATAEICIRLDGLPLALELAAARVRSMTVAEIVERLDERFRLLAGRHTPHTRRRDLLDVVDWSHGLLDPAEQALFARLSVFAGGFTLRRAEDVCSERGLHRADVAALLSALVDKSMVVAREVEDETRFRLLQTLRAFARTQLDARPEAEAIRLAHARASLDAARAAHGELGGPRERRWIQAIDREMDDLREAFATSLALGELDVALELVTSVREFAFRTIRYEVCRWAEAVASVPEADGRPLFPIVLGMVAYGRFVRGELTGAVVAGRQAVESAARLGVPTTGLAERALGNALFYRGETEAALAAMDRMVDVAELSRDAGLTAHGFYMRSVAATSLGDVTEARRLADLSCAAAERSGAPTARAQAAYATGLAWEREDPDRALRLLQESTRLAESAGNRWLRAFVRTEELSLRAARGDLAAAVAGYPDVVETWFRGGDWANQWLSLRHLFTIFTHLGRDEAAAVLHGAIDAAGATTALPFAPAEAERVVATVDTLRNRCGTAEFDRAVARGRTLRDEEVVQLTLETLAVLAGSARRTPPPR
ncbi:BTAD domain-containing putative transcriptional regulator [Actinomycetospora sp. CA-101289]|uniref:BTAD domain-containing putative transcriptional regulator n=1 Tax=Actinomycetospora sp. CA-101289 TaxID=3239893 RepID=UPI003D9860CC